MENSKIENQEKESAKTETIAPKKKRTSKKKESATDSINLDKVKIDFTKENKSLLSKERKMSSKKDLYKGTEGLGEEEKKKFRGKIRRQLHSFVNAILGKDRSKEEKEKSVKAFLKFYKENWKVQNFELSSFSMSQNPTDQKDYSDLLKYVQSILK